MMGESHFELGQFETPLDVADLLLAFSVRRPADRILDPSCGHGRLLERAIAWQDWLAPSVNERGQDCWCGVELDTVVAAAAQEKLPRATVLPQNFFALDPQTFDPFDVVIGNPPYTRAQAIGTLADHAARQMALFPADAEGPVKTPRAPLVSSQSADILGGRSGLYAYFFLHSTPFLREGGRLAFVVPNGWLDVAYGAALKRYLLEHYRVRAIIESGVERWFAEARINTCLIILEKCGNLQRRRNNRVHLVRLRQELAALLPRVGSYRRFVEAEQLAARLLPGRDVLGQTAHIHVVPQKELRPDDKWGIALRSPSVLNQSRGQLDLVPLRQWLDVQRGYTTGANEFFYLTPSEIAEWEIEPRFRRPLLKSMRGMNRLRLSGADSPLEVLLVAPHADLGNTAVAAYVAWGEEQGLHHRTTCAARQPWYSLPEQTPPPLVLPKGIWHRHEAPLVLDDLLVDQQLYGLHPADRVPLLAAAALLNSAWFALQVELQGRVSFGKGLLWLAAYELAQIRLPDPRRLALKQIAALEEAFLPLTQRPLHDSLTELEQDDRQVLDAVVFDVLQFSSSERTAVLDALRSRINSRRRRAASAK